MSENLHRMYENALDAMKQGDREKARNLLSQVVEGDEDNVDAWIALSKVVDNDAEKRICLTTILQLDPSNSYAQKELAKSEAKIEKGKNEEEVAPGITRRMVRRAAIGSAIYIVVVFTITFLLLSLINGSKGSQRAELTRIARNATGTVAAFVANETSVAETQIQVAISQTAAAQLLITPSATFTRTPDPQFATWTPTPTEASLSFQAQDVPLVPATIPGRIFGWGGRDATNTEYLDPFVIVANGAEPKREIINQGARSVVANIPGQMIAFERYDRRFGETLMVSLQLSDPEGTMAGFSDILQEAGAINAENPNLSADGNLLVADAEVSATGLREVFLIDLNAQTFTQLTNDGANYDTPAISQDGTRVLAVRQDPEQGTDLVLIDPTTLDQIQMTSDGDAIIESQPFWHRDGQQAVFRGHLSGQPNNGEIYALRVLPESGATSLLIATSSDEIYPVFDPTGTYVAFASNRAADVYNIYIFEVGTQTTYQLTTFEFDHFPGGWSQ